MSAADLPKKIEAIRAAGPSYVAIAKSAGCDISTLYRIRQGLISDPAYSVGTAIDAMHAKFTDGPALSGVA